MLQECFMYVKGKLKLHGKSCLGFVSYPHCVSLDDKAWGLQHYSIKEEKWSNVRYILEIISKTCDSEWHCATVTDTVVAKMRRKAEFGLVCRGICRKEQMLALSWCSVAICLVSTGRRHLSWKSKQGIQNNT